MKPFVVYTALRAVLFLATWGIVLGVWALVSGDPSLLVSAVVALVVSGAASYVLLNGPRAQFAERVSARADRMVSAFDEIRAREDEGSATKSGDDVSAGG